MDDSKKRITIEESIQYIGDFKLFQKLLAAMFCTMMFPSTYQILILVLAGLNPPWRCVNNSTTCISNATFPPTDKLRCSLPREDWEYVEPKEYSIITWFDIYCDSYWLVQLSKSAVFVGWGVASPAIGYISDRYGRKKVIFLSTLVLLLSSFASAFSPNIHLFIFLRFVVGCSVAGTFSPMMILLSEIVGTKYRPHIGILLWIFWPVSLCVLALKAYYIRNWRTLFAVCSLPYAFVLFFYPFAPESPRILRLQNKEDELMKTLRRIADMNKKDLPSCVEIINPEENTNVKPDLTHLISTHKIRKIFLIQCYGWFTHGLIYYGLFMAASGIGGSFYLNFFLLGAVAIPASIAGIFVTDYFGRKWSTIVVVLVATAACLLLACTPTHLRIVRIIAGLVGIFSMTLSFKTIAVWRIELFPTNIRSVTAGFLTIFTRAGSAASPWLVAGLATVHPLASYICMCVVGVTCAASLCLLHETKGTPLPDTLSDLEKKDKDLPEEENNLVA